MLFRSQLQEQAAERSAAPENSVVDGDALRVVVEDEDTFAIDIPVSELPRGPPSANALSSALIAAESIQNNELSLFDSPEGDEGGSFGVREALFVDFFDDAQVRAPPEYVTLSDEILAPLVDEARVLWAAFGLTEQQAVRFTDLEYKIADLPAGQLGWADPDSITIDATAAGRGWFVDLTPGEHSEFAQTLDQFRIAADIDSDAYGRIDLLTVLVHEIGHVLGYGHDSGLPVMAEVLAAGQRQLPGSGRGGLTQTQARPPVVESLDSSTGGSLAGQASDGDLTFKVFDADETDGFLDVQVVDSLVGDLGTFNDISAIAGGAFGLNDLIEIDIDLATTWNLTGIGNGTLTVDGRGSISFSLIENLTGAATARDTFVLANGAVAGSIDDRAGVLEVQVGDFLVLGGDAGFTKVTESVTLDDGTSVSNASVLKLGLTSGTLFAGINYGQSGEQGLAAATVDLGLAIITDSSGGNTWYAATGTASTITVTGFDGLSLAVSSLAVSVNTAAGGHVVDFDPNGNQSTGAAMIIPSGPTIGFDGDTGELLEVSGSVTLDAFGFVQISGGFALKRSETSLTLADNSDTVDVDESATAVAVDLLTIGLSHVNGFEIGRAHV